MRYSLVIFLLGLSLLSINSTATTITLPEDTIIPSKNKFVSSKIYVPKTLNTVILITQFMDHLKAGKRTMGFLHPDELAMIEEKNSLKDACFLILTKWFLWVNEWLLLKLIRLGELL